MSSGSATSTVGTLCRRPGRQLGLAGLVPAVCAGAVSVACGTGLLATSGWLITRASERPPIFELSVAIGAVQAFALARGIARYVQRLTTHAAAFDLAGRLRLALFDAVQPLVPGATGLSAGSVMSGIVSDADLVAEGFARRLGARVDVAVSVAVGSGLTALLDPVAAGALAAAAALVVCLALAAARAERRSAVDEAALRAGLATAVVETVRAAPELVAFGRLDIVESALTDIRRRSLRLARRRALAVGVGRALVALASGGALLAVSAIGLGAHDAGRLTGVELAVVVFATLATLDQLAGLPVVLGELRAAKAAAVTLERLAATPAPALEPEAGSHGPRLRNVGSADAALWNATVRSGGSTLLDGVTVAPVTGRRLALTGPSGAGKTTALYALLRFVGCHSGRAELGGTDVRDLDRSEIAARAGWMSDTTHVFGATVAENLRLARPEASDGECRGALDSVGLGDWLDSLPGGLDELLGAGGRPMSAGERQRLGLARSLLAGQPVLLLDEPTAHLDPDSGCSTLEELLSAAAGRSVVLVTHDPAVEGLVDHVVELVGGRVERRRQGGRCARG